MHAKLINFDNEFEKNVITTYLCAQPFSYYETDFYYIFENLTSNL